MVSMSKPTDFMQIDNSLFKLQRQRQFILFILSVCEITIFILSLFLTLNIKIQLSMASICGELES